MLPWFVDNSPLPIPAIAGDPAKAIELIARVETAIDHVESLTDYDDHGFTIADLIEDAAGVRDLLIDLRDGSPNYLLFRPSGMTLRGRPVRTFHDYLDYALAEFNSLLTGEGDMHDRQCDAEHATEAVRALWRALVKNHDEIEAYFADLDIAA